ncbi:MAG: flagellar hook-basal body complex protein [Desulfarculus sp.]|nr:flagellar hook-basal body complex protein [Desulfarculus sp.]
MGMLSAMYSGVTGLNVHGRALSGVADNVANLSTYGFKASRTNFGDIMVQSLTVGGTVVNQSGNGARVQNVQTILSQGSFENTDVSTDMAINGKGFFAVRRTASAAAVNQGEIYYTRAGQFLMDKEGYVVNSQGLRLQGYNVDANGKLRLVMEDLRLITQQTDADPTTKVDISINLNAQDTKSFAHTTGLDPKDGDTYNYMTSTRVYDSLGISHDISLYFQKLTDNPTVTPDGTASTWRVSMYEEVKGVLTPMPKARPDNTFYLCFDTNGHMTGSVNYFEGATATADVYRSTASVADPAVTVVSNKVGERITYTGSGSQQSYETVQTLTYTGAFAGTETITIGSKTYTVSGAMGQDAGAFDLAEQINSDNSSNTNYFAVVDTSGANAVVKIYANEGSTYTVAATGANLTGSPVTAQWTMNDIVNGINGAGSYAEGVMMLSSNSAGSLAINGTAITWTANPGGLQNTLDDIVTTINSHAVLGSLVTARRENNQIIITADNVGTEYNYTLTGSGAGTVIPSSRMQGGWADVSVSGVVATTNLNNDGTTSLVLQRNDVGADQTITLAHEQTMGQSQGLSFSTWTQTSFASNAEGNPTTEAKGERTFSFDFPGATPAQNITFDFSPDSTSATTQSAGVSETYYLYQDGAPRGTLQSLDIDTDGLITGQFSNGTLQVLGAVVLVNFQSNESLRREGENLWSATLQAGSPVANRPGQGGLGTVESSTLEQSNVDLAAEFVKMINYQRAFQANSKTISTTDSMLQELINLKR